MHTMSMNAPPTTIRRAGLTLSTEWLNTTVVRISAAGDIDASNTSELFDYVLRRGANCRSLILDLRDVTFFGTAGFSALQTIFKRGYGSQKDADPLHYFAFDLIELDGEDLTGLNQIERKERLEALLGTLA